MPLVFGYLFLSLKLPLYYSLLKTKIPHFSYILSFLSTVTESSHFHFALEIEIKAKVLHFSRIIVLFVACPISSKIALYLKSYIIEVIFIRMIQNNIFQGENYITFRTTTQNYFSDCLPTLWSSLSETLIMLEHMHVYLISSR